MQTKYLLEINKSNVDVIDKSDSNFNYLRCLE